MSNFLGMVKLGGAGQNPSMKTQTPSYRGYPFPSEIISHAIWLYHRFYLSVCSFFVLFAFFVIHNRKFGHPIEVLPIPESKYTGE